MKTALIVVDMQEAFYRLEVCKTSFSTALPCINLAIQRFRDKKAPVIFTRTSEAHKLSTKEGWRLMASLNFQDLDVVIDKDFPNAFWKTSLESILREMSVSSVIVCGCFAMACVYLTHHGALERGFSSSILQNGVISSEDSSILFAMADSTSVSDL
jgi:nicotinamidase-related amidase